MFSRKQKTTCAKTKTEYRLIWTGPRQSDIQDCEKGLFCGSITLFGNDFWTTDGRMLDDSGTVKVNNRDSGYYDRVLEAIRAPCDRGMFNISFCSSPYNPGNVRINHNRVTVEQDVFTLAMQVILLSMEKSVLKPENGIEIRFMSYNPNFVPVNGTEWQFAELERLIGEGGSDEYRLVLDSAVDLGMVERDDNNRISLKSGDLARFIRRHTMCLNSPKLAWLDSKNEFREYCQKIGVPATESITVAGVGAEASLASLKRRLGGDKYVVQLKNSSGGYGTYVFENPSSNVSLDDKERDEKIKKIDAMIKRIMLGNSKKPKTFVLSRYRDPNIPINIHAIIGSNEIMYSRGSVQIIDDSGGRLIYSGADYLAFDKFAENNPAALRQLNIYLNWICKSLQAEGYRGIIGFDIIIGEKIEFVEANNRFQASTVLLNRAFREVKYLKDDQGRIKIRPDGKKVVIRDRKPSLQMLNLFAFIEGGSDTGSDAYAVTDQLYKRCYINYDYHNVINSRNGHNNKFPIPGQELESMPVRYSMFIYYWYENEARFTFAEQHFRHILRRIEDLNHDERKNLRLAVLASEIRILKHCRDRNLLAGLEEIIKESGIPPGNSDIAFI